MDRFEYMSRPLTTETTPSDLDALGAEGWEPCGIASGVGLFTRSQIAHPLGALAPSSNGLIRAYHLGSGV